MLISARNRNAIIAATGCAAEMFNERGSYDRLDKLMDAARAEGEEAGTIKAEHAAAETIARLESKLVAAIYAIPKDTRVGHLQREADRFEAARTSMKVQLDAAEMELSHAIDRAKRAEAEAERFEALQQTLDAWARANGSRVFITSHGHMRFPRRDPIRFTKPQVAEATGGQVLRLLRDHMGEMAQTGRVALTDADIAMFWPGEDPAEIRRQYRAMWAPAK